MAGALERASGIAAAGSLRRFALRQLRTAGGITELVAVRATADAINWARACGLHCILVDVQPSLVPSAEDRFTADEMVRVHEGRPAAFLRSMEISTAPRLYYLNGYLPPTNTRAADPGAAPSLLEELAALVPKLRAQDFVIINEACVYFEQEFYEGGCPVACRRWHERSSLLRMLQPLQSTHHELLLLHDRGYLVLEPRAHAEKVASWLTILPHDRSVELPFAEGVPGVTAISIQRRLADGRFSNRYFVGDGIDVGAGVDSLKLYAELFASIRSVFIYDRMHGDAQELANVPDDSFDFLYSSHCLEHLDDPRKALRNWIRVVKPGGHLVIDVPDEDLYEQGHWPSRFNDDHKQTFTICKARSWSPVSVNVVDLVQEVSPLAQVVSLQLIDHAYRYSLHGSGVDQTATPLAEAAIELILRKPPRGGQIY